VSERRRRWLSIVLIVVAALVLVFYLGGGYYFSDVLDERALDAEARRAEAATLEPNVEVVAVSTETGTITIRATTATDDEMLRDVEVGLRWASGYAKLGPLDAVPFDREAGDGPLEIERPMLMLEGSSLGPGTPAELDVRSYPTDPMRAGLDLVEISVPGPLGAYPAWFGSPSGDSSSDTWAIVVHGNSLSPADGLRMVPIFTQMGHPTMVSTYRNDPGAPPDPSGKLRYGLTEWEDLEAMVRYSLEQGSDGVILDGYSMGAAVVMAFLQRSGLADEVRGVVFDAPMLDFSETVDDNASREEVAPGVPLPSSLTSVAKWMAERRAGVDWTELDYLAETRAYEGVRFLVFHGTADTTVPIATSREFERLLPEQVELIEVDGAEHIESWNLDPTEYARRVQSFVRSV
jgi:pimeloyl-ACP methyl ester carboxylesterase